MIEVSNCVICEGTIRHLRRALVAPFIAKRIWNKDPFQVNLVQCEQCGFAFYNPRLEEHELEREYSNYRSQEYLTMRRSFEPWYTAEFNSSLSSEDHYAKRRAKLRPVLQKLLVGQTIKRILDYGGDHGDLVMGLIDGAELYLFDISGATPAPGVKPIRKPVDCQADLIINSNVLEHVGFPRSLVGQILQAAPIGGLVFLEVPSESALGLKRLFRRVAQIVIMTIRRPTLAAQLINGSALHMMHEHINYFTERCLSILLRSCGATVIASGSYFLVAPAGNENIAWCLARKDESNPDWSTQ